MVRKRVKLCKGEKLIYCMGILGFVLTLVLKIFCGASTGHLSTSIEKINYELNEQSKKNESLVMKVNELTAFDKVKDVVDNMGLAYNRDNIIAINR